MIRLFLILSISFLIDAESHKRIINGTPGSLVSTNAALIYNRVQSTLCSGSLIGSGLIVTAKHCLKGNPKDYDILLYGKLYKGVKKSTYASADIGVLKINSTISKGKYRLYKNLYLPQSQNILILGYGSPNDGKLYYGLLALVKHLNSNMFIAANNVDFTAGCPGDSGGPAVVKSGSSLYLVGVLSGGSREGCNAGNIIYYVNPNSAKIYTWLNSKIRTLK